MLWLEQRRLTARNGRFPSHGAHVLQSKRQYHDEHEPQKHQKRVVQEGGDRQGEKRTKRIKAVGTGCYVDMTRQTTWAIFSLFYSPSSPLGPSDESIISFLHLVFFVIFSSNILAADFLFCFTTIMREGPGRQGPEREDCPESKARQGKETRTGMDIFLWDGSPKAETWFTLLNYIHGYVQSRAEKGGGRTRRNRLSFKVCCFFHRQGCCYTSTNPFFNLFYSLSK